MSASESQSTRVPTDLAAPGLSPDDCYMWDDECEYGIQSDRPRATAISNYAHECGCRFQDVVCRRRYMALLTRQESWDAHARDNAGDDAAWDWAEKHGYKFRDGEFRDEAGDPHKPPEFDETVPADWQADEGDPVWSFCDKGNPDAIPCWHLEAKS